MTDTMVLERPITEVLAEPFVQAEPQHERSWIRGWADAPVRIRGLEHLMVLLTTLSPDNDHAGVTDDLTGAWPRSRGSAIGGGSKAGTPQTTGPASSSPRAGSSAPADGRWTTTPAGAILWRPS